MSLIISNDVTNEKQWGRLEEIQHSHNVWQEGKDLSSPIKNNADQEVITTVKVSSRDGGINLASLVMSPARCRNLLNKNEIRDFLEKYQNNMSEQNIKDIKDAFTEDQIRGFAGLAIQEFPGSQYKFETQNENLPEVGEVHFHYDTPSFRQNERRVILAYEKVPHFKKVGEPGEIVLLKLGTGQAANAKEFKQDFLNLVKKYQTPLKKLTTFENGKAIAMQMGGVLIKGFDDHGSKVLYAVVQDIEDEYDAFPDYHESGANISRSNVEFVSGAANKRHTEKEEAAIKVQKEIPSFLPTEQEEEKYNDSLLNAFKN